MYVAREPRRRWLAATPCPDPCAVLGRHGAPRLNPGGRVCMARILRNPGCARVASKIWRLAMRFALFCNDLEVLCASIHRGGNTA